jgi:hypothetical protein
VNLPYQPYYCEENAWRICEALTGTGEPRRPIAAPDDAAILFVFSDAPWVALHNQRVARPGHPTYWDYHVVATARIDGTWYAFDPDSRITPGVTLATYLSGTFPGIPIHVKDERERMQVPRPHGTPAASTEPAEWSPPEAEHPGIVSAPPLFRWVPWNVARTAFGSDRRHMLDEHGALREPPPPWPPINPEHHNLPAFLSADDNGIGCVYTLPDLIAGLHRGD